MKICIDAGHGGLDPGAVGTNPVRLEEKEFNLQLALLLERELEQRGHWVVMTRRIERSLSLNARSDFANRLVAELFISIHANAAVDPNIEGMEVFHFPGSQEGGRVANSILTEMINQFPTHRNRGVKEANFSVLRRTTMPAVLIESEFISNPDQLIFLNDTNNQQQLAQAITRAL
jgi:N-acetylmuramoyl-L-alanine amidase